MYWQIDLLNGEAEFISKMKMKFQIIAQYLEYNVIIQHANIAQQVYRAAVNN